MEKMLSEETEPYPHELCFIYICGCVDRNFMEKKETELKENQASKGVQRNSE